MSLIRYQNGFVLPAEGAGETQVGPVGVNYSLLDVPRAFTGYLGFDPNGNSACVGKQ